MAEKKAAPQKLVLYRSETNKMLGGICGGLSETFNIDPTIIRFIFLLAVFFGGGGLILYLIMWIIIPSESQLKASSDDAIKANIAEMKEKAQNFSTSFSKDKHDVNRPWFAIVLIILGIIFLFDNFGFGQFINIGKLWPLFLIALGFVIFTRRNG